MKSTFPIILMFAWCGFASLGKSEAVKNNSTTKSPVFISYLKKTPPDSIQDFVKVYLQTKKLDVIDWESVMQLFNQEMNEKMMLWIKSGKIDNNKTKSEEFVKSLNSVCTVLAVDLYQDSTKQNSFVIDSILWHTGTMPVKDSNFTIYKFISPLEQKINPYLILKSFADEVIISGKLN
ncbi:MAG: hypothetical protein NTW29_07945 [Bacteroidetes bacterium]|nr:hypothetical protein [Bacteroidota bacterium]